MSSVDRIFVDIQTYIFLEIVEKMSTAFVKFYHT